MYEKIFITSRFSRISGRFSEVVLQVVYMFYILVRVQGMDNI